ncbi:MAG: hypothetical protein IT368_11135, partial [Candidatus Hydrogenedentes bacterium]|nr:hypothetical protein [Candidatus Hydrogenedentota bacterium]
TRGVTEVKLEDGGALRNATQFHEIGSSLFLFARVAPNEFALLRLEGPTAIPVLPKLRGPKDHTIFLNAPPQGEPTFFFSLTGSLFCSDGTPAGSSVMAWPGAQVPEAAELHAVRPNGLIVVGLDGVHGWEPWFLPVPAAPPVLLADIEPGMADSVCRGFCNADSAVYFQAKDEIHGIELWKTDETAQGTRMLVDINPGGQSSDPHYLVYMGDRLFFVADDGLHGKEPWVTDGTATGTRLLADLNPGVPSSGPWSPTLFNGRLFFCANTDGTGEEMFSYDPVSEQIELYLDAQPGPANSGPGNLTVAGPWLYFTCDDGNHGEELWRTDGAVGGSALVRDIATPVDSAPSNPRLFTPWPPRSPDGALLFWADVPGDGPGLYSIEPNAKAARLLCKAVLREDPGSTPSWMAAENLAYFIAHRRNGEELQLWATDGTHEGTSPFLSVDTSSGAAPVILFSRRLKRAYYAQAGGTPVFGRLEGRELIPLPLGLPEAAVPQEFVLVDLLDQSFIYIQDQDATTHILRLDASEPPVSIYSCPTQGLLWQPGDPPAPEGSVDMQTETGQEVAVALCVRPPAEASSEPPVTMNHHLYFSLYTPELGRELWTSDGTAAGTMLVLDAFPGAPSSSPHGLSVIDDVLYFIANHPRDGKILWRSEGLAENTAPLAATATSTHYLMIEMERMAPLGNNLAIAMRNPLFGEDDGMELGIIHLLPEGNRYQPVQGFPHGPAGWMRDMAVSGDRIYYAVPTEESSFALWCYSTQEGKPFCVSHE